MESTTHNLRRMTASESQAAAGAFHQTMKTRRSVRNFCPDPLPEGVIEKAILTAGTAPNGANLQPWHFAIVRSAGIKRRIREAAEAEERKFYQERALERRGWSGEGQPPTS